MSLNSQDVCLLEFILVAVFAVFILNYFSGQHTSLDIKCTVYLSWVFGISGILLLPYDISVNLTSDDGAENRGSNSHEALHTMWTSVYWITFIFAWVIIPIQMEYHSSGYFTTLSKLKDGIQRNLSFYGICILIAALYIIFMAASNQGRPSDVIDLLMAIGNTYGILLLILLCGSGLVLIPRRIWQLTDYEEEMKRVYISVASTEETFRTAKKFLDEAETQVRDVCRQARQSASLNAALMENVDLLDRAMGQFNFNSRSSHAMKPMSSSNSSSVTSTTASTATTEATLSMQSVVEAHAKLKRSQYKALACERAWSDLGERAELLQSTLSTNNEGLTRMAVESTEGNAGSSLLTRSCSSFGLWQFSMRFASMSLLASSIVLLWCEMLMSSDLQSPIGLMIGAYHQKENSIVVSAIAFLFLAYMSMCCYYSLFCLNLGPEYSLVKGQSPPQALLLNACYFSRLQFSLGFNFLLLINADRLEYTSFHSLMSNMSVIPVFGTSLTIYLPVTMVLVALLTLTNWYHKIIRYLLPGLDIASMPVQFFYCCGTAPLEAEDLEALETGTRLLNSAKRREERAAQLSCTSITTDFSFRANNIKSITTDASKRSIDNPIIAAVSGLREATRSTRGKYTFLDFGAPPPELIQASSKHSTSDSTEDEETGTKDSDFELENDGGLFSAGRYG